MKKVAIVGSGIGGIASAIRLAKKGHHITVFEKNSYPGGKLTETGGNGFRFDAGPSLFTLPNLVDELFELCEENPSDHFQYHQLTTLCHYFYEDGTKINAYADHQKLIQELNEKTGEPKKNLANAIKHSELLYALLSDLFMFRSLNDVGTFFSKKAKKAISHIAQLGFTKTMHGANKKRFQTDKITQLFNRYATYNGSSPYKTPATMNIIPHLEISLGAFFPKGGMHAITQSLVALAERQGVKFHLNSPVEEILVENKSIKGIRVNGADLAFDRVITNADMVSTYERLLPKTKAPKLLLQQPKSSSALIFYWGIRQKFDQLDVHNIFFSEDYKTEFEHIFDHKTLHHDPTVYVHISSKIEPDDAPEGCENWFVMINTPNNENQNWEELIAEARKNILSKLSRLLNTPIEELIVFEDRLDPITIESRTGSSQGALYGNSSNNLFAAFLRHANVSQRIKGLYFCGGSVHPGGGIPMCLSSAKIVDRYFR